MTMASATSAMSTGVWQTPKAPAVPVNRDEAEAVLVVAAVPVGEVSEEVQVRGEAEIATLMNTTIIAVWEMTSAPKALTWKAVLVWDIVNGPRERTV